MGKRFGLGFFLALAVVGVLGGSGPALAQQQTVPECENVPEGAALALCNAFCGDGTCLNLPPDSPPGLVNACKNIKKAYQQVTNQSEEAPVPCELVDECPCWGGASLWENAGDLITDGLNGIAACSFDSSLLQLAVLGNNNKTLTIIPKDNHWQCLYPMGTIISSDEILCPDGDENLCMTGPEAKVCKDQFGVPNNSDPTMITGPCDLKWVPWD